MPVLKGEDASALFRFFSAPEISGPIYTIEKPVTLESCAAHIERKLSAQTRGEGLMCALFDEAGEIISYMDFTIWPNWSAAEFGGAMRSDRQSRGQGRSGMAESMDWVFGRLGVNLLCFTAALDKHRSIHMIDASGMRRAGEVTSTSPDGSTRQSLVWEITADEWKQGRND
ncbi:GNAT family N-acetyltransferase [Ponticaulis sp.]|uniref:GNAT family N-acetyltransferase n=1 Tax=Ponticaulis sp. TaxID=2020902 RepID=UPI000B69A123|nr:GNAT family N-acetyltransferase [Ponticaulis sp.]MAI90023.1 hypothetical protein [Ponticaulis sp.]OUX99683.1 MAG: hypothetical protein CBB65_06245 [Hyphomonadaceae bacterium TMED5]|tara:strand:- start:20133 stop:20645 length:513 start_codon:yes stop_codon:yes gene_type:complete